MISPSLIDMWTEGCQRATAGKYWGEEHGWARPPQGDGAGLGDELHKIGEDYINYGKAPDRLLKAGEMFIEGLPYLPPPGSGGVEGEFTLKVAGVPYIMRVDYRGPLPAHAMFDGKYEPVDRVVLDHKTSSNPKRYGVWGRETFLKKAQPLIYGAADLVQSGDKWTRLRWLYYWSKGTPKAEPSDAVLSKSEISDAFGELIHPVAVKLVQLKKDKPHPLTLEPNTSHCPAYATRDQRERGVMGCAFHVSNGGPCNPSPLETFAGVARALETTKPTTVKEPKMSEAPDLVAMLAAANAKKQGGAAAPASTGATATTKDPINSPEASSPAVSGVRPASTPAAAASAAKTTPATPPPAPGVSDHAAHVARVIFDELAGAFRKIADRL